MQPRKNPESPLNDDITGEGTPSSDQAGPDQNRIPVAGIGASAGGRKPSRSSCGPYRPTREWHLFSSNISIQLTKASSTKILTRAATMPVLEIQDGMPVKANTFNVIPPNTSLTIAAGILKIEPRSDAPAPHFPIDRFLCSLAEDLGSQAIAVILSGTGSDGAEGLKAVKAAGGITFAQAENTAKYTGMPLSAIATGSADFILPPQEIAGELPESAAIRPLCEHRWSCRDAKASSHMVQQSAEELERELTQARARLRSVAEEHEATMEELRASNEEVRSANEELQSTNEELGTTQQELQSVNQELTTVNKELRTKNADLAAVNDDLNNLFSAANLPVIMADNCLRIRVFYPPRNLSLIWFRRISEGW